MEKLAITGINHVCVVTRDLDRAVRTWWERYGVGPWKLYRYGGANMTAAVDGEPASFAMRAGLAQLGAGSRVEVIQPLDEDNPYADSLRAHDGADHIHHVRLDVEDYDDALTAMAAAGVGEKMSAAFAGGADDGLAFTATYLDTDTDIGFLLELGQAPSGFTMPDPESVYPP